MPKMDLDDVFVQKEDIASAVREELGAAMKQFGFYIHQALVTDIDPNHNVKKVCLIIESLTC